MEGLVNELYAVAEELIKLSWTEYKYDREELSSKLNSLGYKVKDIAIAIEEDV